MKKKTQKAIDKVAAELKAKIIKNLKDAGAHPDLQLTIAASTYADPCEVCHGSNPLSCTYCACDHGVIYASKKECKVCEAWAREEAEAQAWDQALETKEK